MLYMETNPNTNITKLNHGGFLIAVDGFTALESTRLRATILAANLATLQPEETDFHAWADLYVTDIWPDEIVRIHGYCDHYVYEHDASPSDVEPADYLFAAMELGTLDLPDDANFDSWHPTGCQLIIGDDDAPEAAIVMTGWNDADSYDVGIYPWAPTQNGIDVMYELSYDAAGTADTMDRVPCDDLVDHIRMLVTERPWRRFPVVADTNPLPSPISPELLAAAYLDVVRQSPQSMLNVATCDDGDGLWEVWGEITDHAYRTGLAQWDVHNYERVQDAASAAATFARSVCRYELGLA